MPNKPSMHTPKSMRRPNIASARFPHVRQMKSPSQVKPVHTRGYPDVRKPQFGYHHIMKNPSLKDPSYQPFGNKEFIRKAGSHRTVVDQHPSTVFDETKRRMDPLERAKMGLPLSYKAPGQEYMTRSLKYKARGGRPIARGTFIRESRLEEESEKIASDISQGRGYAESEIDKLKKRIPKRKKPEPEGPITGGSLLEIAEKDKARHEQSEKEYNERVKRIAHGEKPEGDKRPLKEKALSFIKADKYKTLKGKHHLKEKAFMLKEKTTGFIESAKQKASRFISPSPKQPYGERPSPLQEIELHKKPSDESKLKRTLKSIPEA